MPLLPLIYTTFTSIQTIIEENNQPVESFCEMTVIDGISTIRFIPEYAQLLECLQVYLYCYLALCNLLHLSSIHSFFSHSSPSLSSSSSAIQSFHGEQNSIKKKTIQSNDVMSP